MNSRIRAVALALVFLCLTSGAAESQAVGQLAVGVRRVTSTPCPQTRLLLEARTDTQRRGTYAGVGMLVGFIAGAAYGNAHTSPSPDRLLTVMLYGSGGMVLGAVGGALLYQVLEGRH